MENKIEIEKLLQRIAELQTKQNEFQKEISRLRFEVKKLSEGNTSEKSYGRITETDLPASPLVSLVEEMPQKPESPVKQGVPPLPPKPLQTDRQTEASALKEGVESFVGTNLINKIGILITIIGVGIGTKYAIDNELINPLTRIVLSYIFGTGLLLVAIRLKKKYNNYSAVLLSGALAIMYFTTYIAYDFYALFPQMLAFALMFVFTLFSVAAALSYDKQVIAAIGLVGAYGIPFLLSNGSGNVEVLFTYIAIVNIAVLIISFFKYWKYVFYLAFAFSWLIFLTWYNVKYEFDSHLVISLLFASVFFLTFYVAAVAYKILRKKMFEIQDILLILGNSFVFYGLGYATLAFSEKTALYLGFFTVANAVVHFTISAIIYRQKLADKNMFFLTAGLVLLFITIAVPVQLDGNWVTLIWGGEALIMFLIGSSQKIKMYERFSYLLILIAFFSMVHDWSVIADYMPYYIKKVPTAFLNINFLTAVLLSIIFGVIARLFYRNKEESATHLRELQGYGLSIIFLVTLYATFHFEIDLYWKTLFHKSAINITVDGFEREIKDYDLRSFGGIWLFNYALFFFSALSLLNLYKLKNKALANVVGGINVFVILISLFFGLLICSHLRENYIAQNNAEYFIRGNMHLFIRYVLLFLVVLNLISTWLPIKAAFSADVFRNLFAVFCHFTILFLASSELLHWMDLADYAQSYKLGLSILWGTYSLFMVVLGIMNKQKRIRVAGIALFGVTLMKLFFYDIANLDTIAKVIVFISLGILLLIISFLYNKYKDVISED